MFGGIVKGKIRHAVAWNHMQVTMGYLEACDDETNSSTSVHLFLGVTNFCGDCQKMA